jgi:hypothetical protein
MKTAKREHAQADISKSSDSQKITWYAKNRAS